MVTRCIQCNLNTPATSISTILLTLKPFHCNGSIYPDPPLPPGDPRKKWKEASLYLCRDLTLRLFYCLFIISTQLYISPRKRSPVNRSLPHPHAIRFLCIKIPLLWAVSLVLHSMGSCILLEDPWSLNAPALIMSLQEAPFPLAFCRLAVSLTVRSPPLSSIYL